MTMPDLPPRNIFDVLLEKLATLPVAPPGEPAEEPTR